MSYGNASSLRTLLPAHVLSQKWQMKISCGRKKFHQLFCVAVTSSPVGNLLASDNKVLRKISVPSTGLLRVLHNTKMSTYLTLK